MEQLSSRADVDLLVRRFYQKVREDGVLGPVFDHVVSNWDRHLVHLSDFWEMILFQSGPGAGKFNPAQVHREVDREWDHGISQVHFGIWLQLWFETIDGYFVGEKAELAKEHARRMAHFLFMRIMEARPS